jgi:DNA-binding MarR family transcriptional regulator
MQLLPESINDLSTAQRCAERLLNSLPPMIRFVRKHMRPHRSKQLSILQFRTLALLRSAPAANLSAVAEFLAASLPTASRVVTSLVSKGLVTRRECESDRRQVELMLTARGVASMDKARQSTQDQLARELVALSPADQVVLERALELLHAVFAPGLRSQSPCSEKTGTLPRG